MPELPEVDVMVSYLAQCGIKNRIVEGVRAYHTKFDHLIDEQKLCQLIGTELLSVTRKAKYILFRFDNGYLVGHNKFSGFWSLKSKPWSFNYLEFDRPVGTKDIRFELLLSGGEVLQYHDARCLGILNHEPTRCIATVNYLASMGPDVVMTPNTDVSFYSKWWNPEDLVQSAKDSNTQIKLLLLDQKKQAGIGNIYACEALWRARINPFKSAKMLSVATLNDLHSKVVMLMTLAVNHSVKYGDYIKVFREKFCKDCGTDIKREVQANRGTYMCPQCQV